MPRELKYNSETMRMEEAEVEAKATTGGDAVTFMVTGAVLKTLLGFAVEDKLPMESRTDRGKAVNSYIRAAIQEFVGARQSSRVAINNRSKEPIKIR